MQSRRIKSGFCLALASLFGCASAYVYPMVYRAPYDLETFDDLLVSNSSLFFERSRLEVQDSQLKIEIPVLISNQSGFSIAIKAFLVLCVVGKYDSDRNLKERFLSDKDAFQRLFGRAKNGVRFDVAHFK